VSLALRLRDRGAALQGAILSISPWCDPTLSGSSIESNADRDKLLSRRSLEFFRSCWLDGTGVDFADPQVNLLNADLCSLPAIAVFYGQDELLASEAFEFGCRAEQAGGDVIVRAGGSRPALLHHRCGPDARSRPGNHRDGQLAALEASHRIQGCLALAEVGDWEANSST
jgi:acetyl esterase/lipase